MISKNKIKEIGLLKNKRGRQRSGLFVVEGDKMVQELIQSDYQIKGIYGLPEWKEKTDKNALTMQRFTEISENDLKKISSLKTPNKVLAIAQQKNMSLNVNSLNEELCIGIDSLQDPGNFGTIIRIANWFGINQIICTEDTVDMYNPKVIQATMGSIFRVNVCYLDLAKLLQDISSSVPVYGAFLKGISIFDTNLTDNGLVIFGNESKGISKRIELLVKNKFHIPSYPPESIEMESLNVSTAVAITCAEFRRQLIYSK